MTFPLKAAPILLLALGVAGCPRPEPPPPEPAVDLAAELAAVQARNAGIAAAETAMDAEASASFWAEDAILHLDGRPPIEGRGAILETYREFFEDGNLKAFSTTSGHVAVAAGGNVAYEYGSNEFIFAGEDGDTMMPGKYLAIWTKTGEEWLVAIASATNDAPEPMPVEADEVDEDDEENGA